METTGEVKQTTAADLGSLLDAGDGAVVTLVAGDTRLVAHSAVLAARSPVFAAMLNRNSTESSDGQVCIPDVEGPVLRQLLAYCYTRQAPQLPDMALKLLVAADKYRLPVLKAECERQVAAQLSVETAAAAAVTSVKHSSKVLRQAAIAFVKTHIFEVMTTEGWADAVHTRPEDVVRLSRLLSETGAPAPGEVGTSPSPSTRPHSEQGDHSHSPASAASRHTPPPADDDDDDDDDDFISILPAPAPGEVGTSPSPSTRPHSEQGDHSHSPASAASRHTPPPADDDDDDDDDDDISLLSMRQQERNLRLLEAAKVGALPELEELLAAGADVGAEDCRGGTALYYAVSRGHVAVVQMLLAAGADHGHRTKGGWTLLHWAAYWGHTEVAVALLEGGADRAARTYSGDTPLDIAKENKLWQLLELLES